MTRRISSSRPMTGSSLPRRARSVRSLANFSSAWNFDSGFWSVTRWLPRTLVSACRTEACVAPREASSSRAGSLFCSVRASRRCSVETYSSLKSAASLKARSRTFCIAFESPGCELEPPTLGSLFNASLARERSCSVGTPTFCRTGTMMPSLSSSRAASMCMGVSSGLPCSSARLVAACTASCDLTVNLSQRIAIVSPTSLQSSPDSDHGFILNLCGRIQNGGSDPGFGCSRRYNRRP